MFAPELAIWFIPLILDGILLAEPVGMVLIQGILLVKFELTVLAFKDRRMCHRAVHLQRIRIGINQVARRAWELCGMIPLAMLSQCIFAAKGIFAALAREYWRVYHLLMSLQQRQAGVVPRAFSAGKDGGRTGFCDRPCIGFCDRFAEPWCVNLRREMLFQAALGRKIPCAVLTSVLERRERP